MASTFGDFLYETRLQYSAQIMIADGQIWIDFMKFVKGHISDRAISPMRDEPSHLTITVAYLKLKFGHVMQGVFFGIFGSLDSHVTVSCQRLQNFITVGTWRIKFSPFISNFGDCKFNTLKGKKARPKLKDSGHRYFVHMIFSP